MCLSEAMVKLLKIEMTLFSFLGPAISGVIIYLLSYHTFVPIEKHAVIFQIAILLWPVVSLPPENCVGVQRCLLRQSFFHISE